MASDTLFGIHGAALEVRSQRMGLLASMEHGGDAGLAAATGYRIPTQTSMDGNTVELSQEQTAFAENAVQYQTTLSFLNGRIGQITRALKGE